MHSLLRSDCAGHCLDSLALLSAGHLNQQHCELTGSALGLSEARDDGLLPCSGESAGGPSMGANGRVSCAAQGWVMLGQLAAQAVWRPCRYRLQHACCRRVHVRGQPDCRPALHSLSCTLRAAVQTGCSGVAEQPSSTLAIDMLQCRAVLHAAAAQAEHTCSRLMSWTSSAVAPQARSKACTEGSSAHRVISFCGRRQVRPSPGGLRSRQSDETALCSQMCSARRGLKSEQAAAGQAGLPGADIWLGWCCCLGEPPSMQPRLRPALVPAQANVTGGMTLKPGCCAVPGTQAAGQPTVRVLSTLLTLCKRQPP